MELNEHEKNLVMFINAYTSGVDLDIMSKSFKLKVTSIMQKAAILRKKGFIVFRPNRGTRSKINYSLVKEALAREV